MTAKSPYGVSEQERAVFLKTTMFNGDPSKSQSLGTHEPGVHTMNLALHLARKDRITPSTSEKLHFSADKLATKLIFYLLLTA